MRRSPSNNDGPPARTATNAIGGNNTQIPSSKASVTTGGYDMLFSRLTKVIKVTRAQGGYMRSTTPDAGVEKELLSNVSGQALCGELTAVMVSICHKNSFARCIPVHTRKNMQVQ